MIVNSEWYWQEEILVCRLLATWQHGFFTRQHAPQAPKELQKYFNSDSLNPSSTAYHAKQVHGDRLVDTSEFSDGILLEADGVFATRDPDPISVWTCSADCVPILIGDRTLGTVAAIHAGWRGTAMGILIKAIGKFQQNGSDLANLLVALGPAISGASYQVQTNVAAQVLTTIKHSVGIFADDKIGHCRLDLRLVQQQQLLEIGINNSQIAIAPFCTFQTPEYFFSYRRNCLENLNIENLPKQVQIQWSGIKSNLNPPQK